MKHTWYNLAIVALTISACSESGGYETAENGMQIKYYTKLNGLKPKVGDDVTWRIAIHAELATPANGKTDSVWYSTAKGEEMMGKPMTISLRPSAFKGAPEDGLMLMGKGDSAEFLINVDSFFYAFDQTKQVPAYVKPHSQLVFKAKLLDVIPAADAQKKKDEANKSMQKTAEAATETHEKATADYIAKNKLKMDTTASGLKWRYVKKGSGAVCKPEDGVEVAYKGSLFDGSIFDQNENFKLVAGVGQVIRGWDEMLTLMKQGDKVQVIIPFWMAYGEQAMGDKIPPYSTLVFDMELKKLIPKK